jgi:hypothetical protein
MDSSRTCSGRIGLRCTDSTKSEGFYHAYTKEANYYDHYYVNADYDNHDYDSKAYACLPDTIRTARAYEYPSWRTKIYR